MTSSLVGSEMCIRDSLDLNRGERHPRARRGGEGGDMQLDHRPGDGAMAVSYTHLTLPTICSV
eukprot:10106082-Prorocentrum_lima.AAC.1